MELTYNSASPQQLWSPVVHPVYLLFGEEDRLKDDAVERLINRVVENDYRDFDLERLEAINTTAEAIVSAACQIPFGSDRRLIIVGGMEYWRDRAKQSEVDRLAEGIERLGSTACIVLVAGAEEDEARRKTGVSAKLDNAVKKLGAVVQFRSLRGDSLVDWVVQRARAENKQISPEAANRLIGAVGSEMRFLEMELIKLTCYVGERREIEVRDVDIVASISPEDVMFTTIDAVSRRQSDRALALLSELHNYDPKPQAVAGKFLALLARQYRMLWQAKYLAERRVNARDIRSLPPDISSELPTESNIAQIAFKAGELFTLSKTYSWSDLTGCLDLLLRCDLANKGGVTDELEIFGADTVTNLQLLVIQLTRPDLQSNTSHKLAHLGY